MSRHSPLAAYPCLHWVQSQQDSATASFHQAPLYVFWSVFLLTVFPNCFGPFYFRTFLVSWNTIPCYIRNMQSSWLFRTLRRLICLACIIIACVLVYVCVCTYMFACVYMFVCVCVCLCVRTHTCTRMFVCFHLVLINHCCRILIWCLLFSGCWLCMGTNSLLHREMSYFCTCP